jgi:hypothetical protein
MTAFCLGPCKQVAIVARFSVERQCRRRTFSDKAYGVLRITTLESKSSPKNIGPSRFMIDASTKISVAPRPKVAMVLLQPMSQYVAALS